MSKRWGASAAVASVALAASLVAAGAFPGGDFSFTNDIVINGVSVGIGAAADPDSVVIGLDVMPGPFGGGGTENTLIGHQVFHDGTNISVSTAVGAGAGREVIDSGSDALFGAAVAENVHFLGQNSIFGCLAGRHGSSNTYSSGFGYASLSGADGANYTQHSAFGAFSFLQLADGAVGGVAVGYSSGRYETGSHAFYVNDIDQGDTATEKANSLLYGTFGANAAAQMLTVNAIHFMLPHLPTSAAGLAAGTLWNSSGVVHVA